MKKTLVALTLFSAAQAFAADSAPTDSSVHNLLKVTNTSQLIDSSMSQMDSYFNAAIEQGLQGKTLNAEQQKIVDDMRTKSVAVVQKALSWEKMEPVMTDIYKKSFNQREIDAMLKFYQSEEGRSVVTKMPIAMQNSIQAIQVSTMNIAPELNKILADGKQQLLALDKEHASAK
jgi:hypothetical protein